MTNSREPHTEAGKFLPVLAVQSDSALAAAELGSDHRLALADSGIMASARRYDAALWTQDADFQGLDGVRYFAKP